AVQSAASEQVTADLEIAGDVDVHRAGIAGGIEGADVAARRVDAGRAIDAICRAVGVAGALDDELADMEAVEVRRVQRNVEVDVLGAGDGHAGGRDAGRAAGVVVGADTAVEDDVAGGTRR